jgi:hypothetical protein
MPQPLSSTIQLPRLKFTETSILVASASSAFSSRASTTPDKLVICFEELICEIASSDSGKIRDGIEPGVFFVRQASRLGKFIVTALGGWVRAECGPTLGHASAFYSAVEDADRSRGSDWMSQSAMCVNGL